MMLSLCLTFICSHALRLTGIEEPALCKATTQDTHHEVANLERDPDLSSNEEFLKGYSKEFSEAAAIGLSKQSYDLASKLNVKRAFVTTTTLCPTTHGVDPRTYLKHVLVLGHALQAVNSSFPLVALIMDSTDCHLVKEYDGRELKELNMIFVRVPVGTFNQDEMPKPQKENWRYTFPKTYIWAMTGFQKLVFLDGDVIVMKISMICLILLRSPECTWQLARELAPIRNLNKICIWEVHQISWFCNQILMIFETSTGRSWNQKREMIKPSLQNTSKIGWYFGLQQICCTLNA